MGEGGRTDRDRSVYAPWMHDQYRDSSNLRARAALHERFGTRRESWHRWLFDHYTFPEGAAVLEVGCGPGDLWDRNRDRLRAGWRILLTDLSPGMVAEARQRLHGVPRFSYAVADVQALPLGDAAADAVIANQMLSHAADLGAALGEVRRVLRPRGTLYAATGGRAHMGEVTALLREFDPALGGAPRADGRGFALEDAEGHLSPWFTGIRTERFESTLQVTEAAPLVAYVYSMSLPGLPGPERRAAFTRFVEGRLRRDGVIRISRITGLLIAAPR